MHRSTYSLNSTTQPLFTQVTTMYTIFEQYFLLLKKQTSFAVHITMTFFIKTVYWYQFFKIYVIR